jgi:hypothetical protein
MKTKTPRFSFLHCVVFCMIPTLFWCDFVFIPTLFCGVLIIPTLLCGVFVLIPRLCCVFLYSCVLLWSFCFHSYIVLQHNLGIKTKTPHNNVEIMKNTTKQCRNENKNTTKQCRNNEKHHKTM